MLALPKKAETDDLKNYILEKVEEFTIDNEAAKKEFKVHTMMLRRFDEVIALKANKMTCQ